MNGNGNSLSTGRSQILHSDTMSLSVVRFPTIDNHFSEADVKSALQPLVVNRRKPDVTLKTPKSPTKSGGQKSALRGFSSTPSLWSCGVVVGVIFCLMNKQVNAHPVQDNQMEKRSERIRRSATTQDDLDDLAFNWFLRRSLDRKDTQRNFKSRVSRSIADQILSELEAQWLDTKLGADATHPKNARQRRFAPSEDIQDLVGGSTDRVGGGDLIINELTADWLEAHSGAESTSKVRTKRSRRETSEETSDVTAEKAEESLASPRSFDEQHLAHILVRQRPSQPKTKSGLLTKIRGGASGEVLEASLNLGKEIK